MKLEIAALILAGVFPSTKAASLETEGSFQLFDHHRNLQGPPPVDPEIFSLAISISTFSQFLGAYETPIALRFTSYFGAMWWNCIAAYSDDYTDTLTKEAFPVPVPDAALYTKTNRVGCMMQATADFTSRSLPEALPGFLDVIFGNNPFGIDYTGIVVGVRDPLVDGCGSDITCLQLLAASEDHSPTVMGQIVSKLAYDYSIEDGYNQLGTDDGCTVSCRPYSDTTDFTPRNNPYNIESKKIEQRWEPLLEDNGKGFFYRQEHVTPQIGEKAKFRYLSEPERYTRVASEPGYSKKRISESLKVIDLMAQLDDNTKVEVEIFDDKLLVGKAVINSFLGNLIGAGFQDVEFPTTNPMHFVSLERFVNFASGYVAAEQDAAIVAWKQKVTYDLVRPTSIIKKFGGDITTWAPGGIQTFPAEYFEAYIRVMPHSEYVSGSSCLFQSVQEYVEGYMAKLGLDRSFPVAFDPFVAGSSSVEPGVVPASDITLSYARIADMAAAGSQSRLNGGMHFEESVQAGIDVCTGVGEVAVDGTFGLYRSMAVN